MYPYDSSYEPLANVPIVTGATAWTDTVTSITYILVFHESLFYGPKLDHSLINPNQVRHHNVDFWDNPFNQSHKLSIQVDGGPIIPLTFQGTKQSFTSRVPTTEELSDCQHIELTSRLPWNPKSINLWMPIPHRSESSMAVILLWRSWETNVLLAIVSYLHGIDGSLLNVDEAGLYLMYYGIVRIWENVTVLFYRLSRIWVVGCADLGDSHGWLYFVSGRR